MGFRKDECIECPDERYLTAFLQAPSEEFTTGWTEISHFGIRILNTGGGVHHAGAPPAVGKSQGMTQFMESGFD